jgi:tRNA modification GTPase
MQEELEAVREALISLMAQLEAVIDFPEEELDLMERDLWNTQLEGAVLRPVARMIGNFEEGLLFREGLSLVIVGKPNVGKSSLLNRLLQEERAIVTPIPGTTRDTIEETILIKGLPFRLIDTAGLHQARDGLEEAGMRRTREKVKTAHLLLFLLDAAASLEAEDDRLFKELKNRALIILANKADLPPLVSLEEIRDRFPGPDVLPISARYGQGIEELKDTLSTYFLQASPPESLPEFVPTLRQKLILEDMKDALERALNASRRGDSPELIAFELQGVMENLGGMVGAITSDEVLEKVFSQFCIGK